MKKLFILFIILFAWACKSEPPKVSLQQDVSFLADDALEGRRTGTAEELQAAEYLAKRMENLGLQPKGQANSYFQTFTFKPSKDPHQKVEFIEAGNGTTTGTNVLGYLDNKSDKTIVIGAHYDHLGLGGEGSLHRGEASVHNGADDNASGVAVMLKLAELLQEKPLQHNVLFMAFSGEEMGLLGSNYFTKNPTIDLEQVNFMLNFDMVGRMRPDRTLSVSGTGTAAIWPQTLNANNNNFKLVLKESGVGPSDHTSFYLQDIPVLHFFTGQHEDYHKPSDDADKLNYAGMQAITSYVEAIVLDLDDDELTFKRTKNESEEVPRFKVGLGVIPDYLFDGQGMRIDGISEDKPAQKAGLQKGDIVIKLGDSTVTNMMSYMRALSVFDKGQTTQVVISRNGKEETLEITF